MAVKCGLLRTLIGSLILIAGPAGRGSWAAPLAAQDSLTPAQAIDSSWLSYDTTTKTVRFRLVAGLTGLNGALNFNGFSDGTLMLIVPVGSKVVMDFFNHDGMLPHSAEVIPAKLPVPTAAVDPAIPRAYTDKVEEGLPPQAKSRMTFTATPAGDYFIFCGVPGHGRSGMYIKLQVNADAKISSLQQVPKPSAGR